MPEAEVFTDAAPVRDGDQTASPVPVSAGQRDFNRCLW